MRESALSGAEGRSPGEVVDPAGVIRAAGSVETDAQVCTKEGLFGRTHAFP